MPEFADLSWYTYASGVVPGAKNVGWIGKASAFEIEEPESTDLDLLWEYCKVGINATRGLHACELCPPRVATERVASPEPHYFTRNGETALLGYSEIRVISQSGQSYAAPSLIFHYLRDHHYKPPSEFLLAMRTGPRPSSTEYLDGLRTRGLDWSSTLRSS